MERETTAAALQEVLNDRAEHEGIVTAYLFGSVARGTARPDSDVDVAVLLEKDPPPTLAGLHLDLEGDLEKRLGRSVQLVVLNKAPCDLGVRVIRDGLILVDRDRARRLRYEVQTRKEFWDLEPYLRLYRRMP